MFRYRQVLGQYLKRRCCEALSKQWCIQIGIPSRVCTFCRSPGVRSGMKLKAPELGLRIIGSHSIMKSCLNTMVDLSTDDNEDDPWTDEFLDECSTRNLDKLEVGGLVTVQGRTQSRRPKARAARAAREARKQKRDAARLERSAEHFNQHKEAHSNLVRKLYPPTVACRYWHVSESKVRAPRERRVCTRTKYIWASSFQKEDTNKKAQTPVLSTSNASVDEHLRAAAGSWHLGLVHALLAQGANPNAVCEKSGCSALHQASACGDAEVVELLLQHKADPSLAVNIGRRPTALHLAVEGGHVEVVRVLLEYGARASICDNEGTTVLQTTLTAASCTSELTVLTELLVACGADGRAPSFQNGIYARHIGQLDAHNPHFVRNVRQAVQRGEACRFQWSRVTHHDLPEFAQHWVEHVLRCALRFSRMDTTNRDTSGRQAEAGIRLPPELWEIILSHFQGRHMISGRGGGSGDAGIRMGGHVPSRVTGAQKSWKLAPARRSTFTKVLTEDD